MGCGASFCGNSCVVRGCSEKSFTLAYKLICWCFTWPELSGDCVMVLPEEVLGLVFCSICAMRLFRPYGMLNFWIWGEREFYRRRFTVSYTAPS